jgi:WD40 repeat protein
MMAAKTMTLIVVLALVTGAGAEAVAQQAEPVDALPAGAVARIGSTRFRHDAPLGRVHYSGDSKTLLGEMRYVNTVGQTSRLWDVDSGKQLPQFRGKLLGDDLMLSPDGKFLVDRHDNAARLWDVAAGKVVRTWGGESDPKKKDDFLVSWPRFSRDGKILIVPGTQGEKDLIRRFNLKTGAELPRYEMSADSFNPHGQMSPDGRFWLGTLNDDRGQPSLRLVDLDSGKERQRFENSAEPGWWWGTEFSPDGKTLIGLAEESEIFIWNAATGKLVRRLENGNAGFRLRGPTFSPDGKLFTVNDNRDANVLIFEVATGKLLRSVSNGGLHNACVFSPDSKLLLAPAINEVCVWEVATGNKVCRFDVTLGPDGAEPSVAFSPDGKRIAFTDDRLIRVGDVATGKLLHPDEGYHFMPAALVFSPDGKTLTIGDPWDTFQAWNAATGKHLKAFSKPQRWSAQPGSSPLGFPRDGRVLAAFNGLEYLFVWDVRAGKEVQSFDDDIWCWCRKSAFSADARLLATTSEDGDIHVLDIASGKKLHRFQWYAMSHMPVPPWRDDHPTLAFTPDGRSLAALGLSRPARDPPNKTEPQYVVRVWELATGKERQRFPIGERDDGPGTWPGLKWTADGKTLAIANRDVVLFSVATGKAVRRFSGPSGLNGEAAVFSGDGKLLAAPDATGKVYL